VKRGRFARLPSVNIVETAAKEGLSYPLWVRLARSGNAGFGCRFLVSVGDMTPSPTLPLTGGGSERVIADG